MRSKNLMIATLLLAALGGTAEAGGWRGGRGLLGLRTGGSNGALALAIGGSSGGWGVPVQAVSGWGSSGGAGMVVQQQVQYVQAVQMVPQIQMVPQVQMVPQLTYTPFVQAAYVQQPQVQLQSAPACAQQFAGAQCQCSACSARNLQSQPLTNGLPEQRSTEPPPPPRP